MSAPGQCSLYDGPEFMGSFSKRPDGLVASGRDYKKLGKFTTRKEAVVAIVARYVREDVRAAPSHA